MGGPVRPRAPRRPAWTSPARVWLPATVAVALTAAGVAVLRVPREALADIENQPSKAIATALTAATPVVTYQLGGSGRARISYLTEAGESRTDEVVLPWSVQFRMSTAMRPASVTATALSGGPVTCRLLVDGTTRDERVSEGPAGQSGIVLCSVVAA